MAVEPHPLRLAISTLRRGNEAGLFDCVGACFVAGAKKKPPFFAPPRDSVDWGCEMNLSVSWLKSVTDAAFSALQDLGLDEVEIPALFWQIGVDQIYNPDGKPTKFTLGDFDETVEFLENARANQSMSTTSLRQLSALFRAVSEVSPFTGKMEQPGSEKS